MMKRVGFIAGFFYFFLCFSFSGIAGTKEEIIRLQSDILQLQNQIRLVGKSADESNAILKSLLEQLNDQIATTNLTINNLTKAISVQKTGVADSVIELRKEIQALSIKWDDTNTRIASVQRELQKNQLQIQSLREIPSVSKGQNIQPDQVYSAVYNDYLMGNYDLAVAGFLDFLITYSDSEYSDNASFYLGVCYFQKRQYEPAIQAFDQVIKLYPKGDKAAPAYYKKALALGELKQKFEAAETLKRLVTIFPESQEAKMAARELE